VHDKDKQEIDEAIEKLWASNLEPRMEEYDTFTKFVSKNGKRFTRRQKEKANLTEVMLLHLLFRHTEAEELIARCKTSFNAIEDTLYAHRWRRMQLVDELRSGNTSVAAKVKELEEEATKHGWAEEEMRALALAHLVEMFTGHFKPALDAAQRLKLLAQKNKNDWYILKSSWDIAYTYFWFGHFDKALKACLEAKHLFSDNLSKPQHLPFYNLLASCYQAQKQFAPAIKIYQNLLAYLKINGINNLTIYAAASHNLAATLIEQGRDLEKAETVFLDINSVLENSGTGIQRLESHLALAKLYLQQKKHDKMLAVVTKAEDLANQVTVGGLKVNVLELRMLYEKGVGNIDKALAAAEKYFDKYREWQTIEDSEKLKALETKYELQVHQLNQEVMKKELLLKEQEMQMLNSYLGQKDKLIKEFAGHFDELEQSIGRRREIFTRLREMVRTVKQEQQSELENYSVKFNESHRKSMDTLTTKYPRISRSEASTAVMLSQGLSNKEIASLTLTTVRNIEKIRLGLRGKMKLKRKDDLVTMLRVAIKNDGDN
jgi:tetratricopeptide (TPR) repeat protein/DNA-binding CsgD family transcriptional regulator